MKKVYVLDTNVLLSDPNAINSFEDNDVILPFAVLEELDNHKNRPDEIDNTHVDVYTNGLTYAIERFKNSDIAGHVTLLKGERSALATEASRIL